MIWAEIYFSAKPDNKISLFRSGSNRWNQVNECKGFQELWIAHHVCVKTKLLSREKHKNSIHLYVLWLFAICCLGIEWNKKQIYFTHRNQENVLDHSWLKVTYDNQV